MGDSREWFGWEIELGNGVSEVTGPEFGSWIERIHPDDAARVAAGLRQAAIGSGGFEAEFRVVRRDGGIATVAAKGVKAGESRLVGVAQDITPKELLQKIVDHIPVMLVLYDPGLNRFELNREAQRVLGWTNQDANEGDFLAKVYPDPAYRTSAAAYMQTLTPGWREVSPTAKDGSKVASEWANIKLADDRTIGIGIDVRALRESEERFRTMADNIAPLAWMADASGSVFWYNRRWHEYTGTTLEEVQGWGWRKAQHPEHVERVVERIRHSFETGEPWEDTFPLRGGDGQYRWFLSRALPIRDAGGRIARWFGTHTEITDLVEAEERYRGLFDSMQEGFHLSEILCDDSGPVDWRFLAVNPAFERMTGMTREQVVGRTFRETLAGFDWDFWVKRFGQVALTGRPDQVDGFDGGRYWQTAVYSPRRGLFAAIFNDVTERKRAEAEAARQKQEYETLAENAPEVIARFDPEMRHIYINDYGAKVYGFAKEAILGKTNADLGFPEGHVRESMAHFREVCATGMQRTVDFEFESPNLGHQFFSCLFVPEKDDEGRVVSVLAITRDVTERKRAEAAREELIEQLSEAVKDAHRSRSELEAVLQAMQDGVAVFDMRGRVVFLNRAQVKIGAYPTGEQIPQSPSEFAQVLELRWSDGRVVALEERPVARVLRGESLYDLELTGRRLDTGQEWHFSFSGEPVLEPGGRQALAVIVTRDITDRKRAEERVRQTQKLESVGLLAGGIAHDFNNLLTGILGHASMALEEMDAGGTAERIREVMSSAERAANLTRQLLAYSGKGQFVMREINVAEAVNEIAGLVEFSIPKSAQLAVTVERRLPQVRMDPSQLQQVLMNLVINAGEAIGEGNQGRISVRTSLAHVERRFVDAAGEEVGPGRYVCVDVSDTGSGIEDGKRSKIFDPFFTTKFTGRGLGLSAVSGIVRSLKGGITVESQTGHGTTFRVYLPAADGWVESAPAPSNEQREATILVVDDEAAVRNFIAAVLRKNGYRVVSAADGREALAVFEREGEPIAAVVLDVIMPVMGGNDALPKLKELRPDLKVLLTSGYSESEARRLCTAYPGAAFIQKPYTARQMMQAVEGLLQAE